jgi:hypothetical protein
MPRGPTAVVLRSSWLPDSRSNRAAAILNVDRRSLYRMVARYHRLTTRSWKQRGVIKSMMHASWL